MGTNVKDRAVASIKLSGAAGSGARANLHVVHDEDGHLGVVAQHDDGQVDYLGGEGAQTWTDLMAVIAGWYDGGGWDLTWDTEVM